jgi:hypothetical protein
MGMQPLSNARMRLASGFLVSVGLLWGFVALGFVALVGGFLGNAPPWHYLGKMLWWFSGLWIGPVLLTGGAISRLTGRQSRASSISIWAGCFSLTVMVVYQIVGMLHDAADPLIMKPTSGLYAIYSVATLLALLANAAALQLTWKIR